MTRPSTSCSSYSRQATTSLRERLKTIFKKAYELSTLCDIEVCVIHYEADGELKTWPEDRDIVRDMALRYVEAKKRKKSYNLHEFKEKEKAKEKEKEEDKKKNPKKKKKIKKNENRLKYLDWYPIFNHYSPDQLSQLIQSLELTLSRLQKRLRFVEAHKQRNTSLPLNPSQFSLCMYNQGDSTLSQLPLSASQCNQLTNYQNLDCFAMQEPVLQDHLMMMSQDLMGGFDQNNMCMNGIPNRNIQDLPCLSESQAYSALSSVQASQSNNNLGLKNHLMQQQELYDSNHNMSDITHNNFFGHPCLSNTLVPVGSCSNFEKNPYDNMMVGNTSFPQDSSHMLSNYDGESGLILTSSQPSLYTIRNSYLHSDNSRFL